MERYITWYLVFLKLQLKKVSTWFLIFLMVVVLTIATKTAIPSSDNITIGIMNQSGELGEQLVEKLLRIDSAFEFQVIEKEEKLRSMVRKGEADCAFILEPCFDDELKLGKQKRLITSVQSIYTRKANVAYETIYSAFLPMLSDVLLEQKQGEIFGNADPDLLEQMLQENHRLQTSDEVFHVSMETVAGQEVKGSPAASLWENGGIEGIIGLFLFMAVLFARGETLKKSMAPVWQSRSGAERNACLFIYDLSMATIPLLAGVCYLAVVKGRGLYYGVVFVCYAFVCCIWVSIFGRLFRREETYASWMLSLFLVNVVVCPVFVNLAALVPAMGVVNQVFPLGMLLKVLRAIG